MLFVCGHKAVRQNLREIRGRYIRDESALILKREEMICNVLSVKTVYDVILSLKSDSKKRAC